jgi:hypothetical protein
MNMDRVWCEHCDSLGSGAPARTDGCVLYGADALYIAHGQCMMSYDNQGR